MCGDTEPAELQLPLDATAPGVAREFARRSRCRVHGTDTLDDSLLLISELVTNSLRYGGPPIVLALDCDGESVHVRVRDGEPRLPEPRDADDGAEDGRGMTLVQLLSSTWGAEPVVDRYGPGKEVWFELRRQSPAVGGRPAPGAQERG
jgi:anti-sigma regulatory factor (Ser/Thr protein kinase)